MKTKRRSGLKGEADESCARSKAEMEIGRTKSGEADQPPKQKREVKLD